MKKNNEKHICVIMAVCNGATFLSEQIDSIIKNDYKNISLHIYDDCSTDSSSNIIRDYENKYPNLVIGHFNKKNKGVVRNFLEGSLESDGDYYMFCDQDDIWLPEKISMTYNKMCESEDTCNTPVAVFGDARVVDENLNILHESFQRYSGYDTSATDISHMLMENKFIGCTIMFNNALKKKLSLSLPFLKNADCNIRWHDWWIGLLASALGKPVYLDEPLLLYRQHSHNVIGESTHMGYIKNRLSNLKEQKKVLYATCSQGELLEKIYGQYMSDEVRKTVHEFACLTEKNFFMKRKTILKYGFLKSGVLKNIGIMLLI